MDLIRILAIIQGLEEEEEVKKKSFWVHPLNTMRIQEGQFQKYSKYRSYPDKFFQYFRMSIQSFDDLLFLSSNDILKKCTRFRDYISPTERLMVTIRYLSTGMNFQSLALDFLMGRSTIALIVQDTCIAIWKNLQSTEMPEPTEEMWLAIAQRFYSLTNFPNCIGALDGKHVRINCPALSGSRYYNYKKYFSIVLMALADADLRFSMIDVGAYGKEGDITIFKKSNLSMRLSRGLLNLPTNRKLPNSNGSKVPFVIIGDEAFALDKNLMRPFPGTTIAKEKRIFNYRLCRARRTVECAFGVLCNKWRVLHTPLLVNPNFATHIVKAACVLHNYVRRRDGYNYRDQFFEHGLDSIEPESRLQNISTGTTVRQIFMEYFNNEGKVIWQDRFVQ